MSIKNHPNLYAVGLVADIAWSLRQRIRGEAISIRNNIVSDSMHDIQIFVDRLERKINLTIERRNNIEKRNNKSEITSRGKNAPLHTKSS